MSSRFRASLIAVTAAAAMTLAACGSEAPAGSAEDPGRVPVVTSTNVWGDVVEQVGGDQVDVTALVSDPAADPHSFEPTAQGQLAVSKAALVVKNGGGYDDWATAMVDASNSGVPVIDAVRFRQGGVRQGSSGRRHHRLVAAGRSQPHPPTTMPMGNSTNTSGTTCRRLPLWPNSSAELSAIRPDKAAYFEGNTASFTGKLDGLGEKIDAIKAAHEGTPVAITEPVPLYLTEAAGLENRTPDEFSEAIEQGTDVPPIALADTVALVKGKQLAALIYNEQTSSPETQEVLSAAQAAGVAVVPVTETMPADKDYVSWMEGTISALAAALGS